MRAVIIPVVCFVVGTACGIFFSKQGSGKDRDGTGGEQSTLGSAIPGTASSGSNPGTDPGRKLSSDKNITAADLLELADLAYSPTSMIGLYEATEHLDAEALLELVRGIEELSSSDPRIWPVRTSVLTRLAQIDPDAAIAYATTIKNRNLRQGALGSIVTEIAKQDLGKAMSVLRGIEDPSEFQQVASALAMSSAEGAPRALHDLLRGRKGFESPWALQQMYSNWGRSDFKSALASLVDLPHGQQRSYALQGLGKAVTAENLGEGLAFASSLTNTSERSQLLEYLIGSVAATDPQRALGLIGSHGQLSQRKALLGAVASSWIGTDPESAKAWIGSLEDPRDQSAALENSMWNIAAEDPAWASQLLATMPPSNHSSNLASNLVQRWGQSDPEAAAEWITTLPEGRMRQSARGALINHWAQRDPVAAAAFLSGEALGRNDNHIAGQVAGEWVKSDPDAAIAWLDSMEGNSRLRANMIGTMVNYWTHADPKAAANYVITLDPEERSSALSSLMSGWAPNDFDSAQAFVDQLDDQEMRHQAAKALISNSAQRDPQKAAGALAGVTAGLSDEEVKATFGSAATYIASGWAQMDPVAAATWAVELPNAAIRPAVMQSIVNQWAEYEPQAVSEWVTTFDAGPDRDGAVEGLVEKITQDDPEAAFIWATSINDESKRENLIRATVIQWRQRDSDAARAAVESADLSGAQRKMLLSMFSDQ